jgi:hypothetical protein
MSIKTNNHPRELLYLSDFNDKDQAKIRRDYDWMEIDDLEFPYGFFKYRGMTFHLQDFSRYNGDFWDGYHGLNYFAAVLIKLTDDCDHIVLGFESN